MYLFYPRWYSSLRYSYGSSRYSRQSSSRVHPSGKWKGTGLWTHVVLPSTQDSGGKVWNPGSGVGPEGVGVPGGTPESGGDTDRDTHSGQRD